MRRAVEDDSRMQSCLHRRVLPPFPPLFPTSPHSSPGLQATASSRHRRAGTLGPRRASARQQGWRQHRARAHTKTRASPFRPTAQRRRAGCGAWAGRATCRALAFFFFRGECECRFARAKRKTTKRPSSQLFLFLTPKVRPSAPQKSPHHRPRGHPAQHTAHRAAGRGDRGPRSPANRRDGGSRADAWAAVWAVAASSRPATARRPPCFRPSSRRQATRCALAAAG